jgi:tRNA threonylcarbamoyladenosine modification (KEOPS) complex  Pcc1 subunit
MTATSGAWTATLRVRIGDAGVARMLERALRPESEREVPRARSQLSLASPDCVELMIEARDTGAMRAALNTYLSWVGLSLATLRAVQREPSG